MDQDVSASGDRRVDWRHFHVIQFVYKMRDGSSHGVPDRTIRQCNIGAHMLGLKYLGSLFEQLCRSDPRVSNF